jgi:hypothetical protein
MKKRLILMATALITLLAPTLGQSAYELSFQGHLADIEGVSIVNESFNLTVQVLPAGSGDVLYEFTTIESTDQEGWFGFTISSITDFMADEGIIRNPVVIRMVFFPNENTRWMKAGSDFLVTYSLEPGEPSAAMFSMTRMEGSDLQAHSEEHLFAFKDLYPFAYLTGGFLMTDQPPIGAQSVTDLREWLTPNPLDENDDTSRGVKGGFPVGGYHKKN